MKHSNLTKTSINLLPLPVNNNQILHPDPAQDGHYIRVTKDGARAHVCDKNTKAGRIRITLGPAGTDVLTTAQARKQTQIALGLIAQGYTSEQIRDRLARAGDRTPSSALLFGELLKKYLTERRHKLGERTRTDYQRLADTYLAGWLQRPVELLNDEDVVIEKFTSISAPSQANYTFRLVRLLFNFARSIRNDEGKPIVTNNAVAVLSQRRIWHDQKPSRKVIKLAALKAWWDAVQQLQEVDTPRADGGRFTAGGTSLNSNVDAARDFLAFLLLTGLRRNEAATLKWETVDLPAKMLTITKTKNYEAHVLPLSDYLYDMLMRRHAAIPKGEKGTLRASYVFPSEEGPLKGIQKQLDKVIALSGVTFSAQTLRRTFGTIAEGRDIPYLALKRLLNHKAQDVTGGSYTVIDVERLREPMQKITDFILSHVGERPAARVVKIRAAKDKA